MNNYFRSQKLRDFAEGMLCTGCNGAFCDPETSVWAHSNKYTHGKGRGLKAHDCYGAVLGNKCHDFVDGRIGSLPQSYVLPDEYFQAAHDRSMLIIFRAIQSGELKL